MPATQSEKRSIISCKKFDQTKVSITELDTNNERSISQSISYVHYQFKPNVRPENLIFQTGDIKLTDYGIPDLGDFAKEDKERQYVKVPLDTNQSACVELRSMLSELDKYALSKQNDIFGKSSKLYKYVPLVREPIKLEGEELEEKKNAYFKKTGKHFVDKDHPHYCKVKFDMDFDTKALETAVYDSTDINAPPKEIDVSTITELTQHVRWQSTIKMIVMVNKLWAHKTSKKGELREFGLSLKCLVLHIRERAQTAGGSVKDQVRSGQIDFVDDSDDETPAPPKVKQNVASVAVAVDDEDDDNDDDDDEGEVQQTTKVENNDEDEDEDDSDDTPPPPKTSAKVAPKPAPKVAAKPVAPKKATK
jgi:hypothetical protein